jgi:NAD(P)-dependent dehydrogenase (short-subunit alcohol dehydrogenase family)
MENNVVLITGASSGIGKAIGLFLTARGFKVYGTTRDPGKYPGFSGFKLLQLEVRDPISIRKAIASIHEKEGRLDILINNAGVGVTGPMEETPREEVIRVLDINLLGPVAVMNAVLPLMRRQESGLIINITSIAGYMGLPFRGYYSASKGAMELLTEALRMETARSGIRITSLAPGDFATNIAAGRYHAPILDDSPYKAAYEHSLQKMNEDVARGQDPSRVAKKVYQIIGTRKPKVHYTVGSPMQRFSLTLKKLLPDKLYEKLLLNHYKL